ncbi:MAG: ABC transporter substrate-binding protein [Halapricum sp.]
MADDATGHERRTRRQYVKYSGAVIGGGLLAGCAGNAEPESTQTVTDTLTQSTRSTTAADSSYSVSLEPVGEVTFNAIPDEWIAYQYAYGDMGVALGQAAGYLGTNNPGNYPDFFYDELPGVEFDASALTDIGSGDKEVFYELDPDVLFIDPNNARARFEWSQADIEELTEGIAPFFGHFGRRYGYGYQQSYPQLGLYDLFEQAAEVFQEQERYRQVKAVHDSVLERISSTLPTEEERPTIGMLSGGSNVADGSLYLMEATAPGYGRKQYRNLGVGDVLETVETDSPFYQTDFEELLELDPETIVVHWTIQLSDEEFTDQFVTPFENDPVGSELTAVQNDRVFKGGTAEQGPLINLFQTELAARQLYPEIIGDQELFSRDELARAVTNGG